MGRAQEVGALVPTTQRGVPFPSPTSPADAPAQFEDIAEWVDEHPGIAVYTTAQRDALSGNQRWDGMVILNATTNRLQQYRNGVWSDVAIYDHAALAGLDALTAHPQYALSSDLAAHRVAADPHTVYLLKSVVDAKGDLLVASAPDVIDRLMAGAQGAALIADPTAPLGVKWDYPKFHGAKASQSAPQSIPNDTATIVTWDTESEDTDGFHSITTETGKFIIPTGWGGRYRFETNIVWAANASGARRVRILRNGAQADQVDNLPRSGATHGMKASANVAMVPGDYLQVEVTQNSGGALTVAAESWAALVFEGRS